MTEPKEPTHQDWAKRFQIACGNEWHEIKKDGVYRTCSCGKRFTQTERQIGKIDKHIKESNPTYLNPADIIREVMKWDDADEFFASISPVGMCVKGLIKVDLITERPPTHLLKEATLFKEGKK
jgi:hypothetical protein